MTERHTLYRMYDAEECLLYVGISVDVANRFRQHRDTKDWWDEVATIRLERFPSREAVLAAEAEAIRVERPAWNAAHNRDMTRISLYLDAELVRRVRGLVAARHGTPDQISLNRLFNEAALEEAERVEARLNGGEQFPPRDEIRGKRGGRRRVAK